MEDRLRRLNVLQDEPRDEVDHDLCIRARWFGHPFGADLLGASPREFLPGAADGSMHMHYGVEEMFFVLSGNADRPHPAWVATRHPECPVPEGGDERVIARFDLPRTVDRR